jgi:type I restriction enzyme M protein
MTTSAIVSKVWSFCNPLRDVGVGYGDYLEQLTYLLFLKMADEYTKPPYNRAFTFPRLKDGENVEIPNEEFCSWETLLDKKGNALEAYYTSMLRSLSTEPGMIGQIFTKSQNKIQDPAMLAKIIDMINSEQWLVLGADVKGDIYEGLLEQNAQDVKSGAGQYFTPRPLIRAMVECIQPQPMKTIADPACGTGGFFLAAYDYLVQENKMDKEQKEFLKHKTFFGNEIVPATRRMALMNLFLHNIGDIASDNFISPADALIAEPSEKYDFVLANPPFGKKSSQTFTNEQGEQEKDDLTYNRQDFWATTSNKQLNFMQHIRSLLKTTGMAAVVVPDNVLFEGGAGEIVRKKLMETAEVHTILRLPTGIFYANGVKANVIFFDNKPASKTPWTKEIWVYDYRTNIHHTLKKNPLNYEVLKDFIACYNPSNRHKRVELFNEETNPEGRWRKFSYEEIIARDKTSLDITWLKDKSLADLDNLPDPEDLAADIIENLEAGLASFREIMVKLSAK